MSKLNIIKYDYIDYIEVDWMVDSATYKEMSKTEKLDQEEKEYHEWSTESHFYDDELYSHIYSRYEDLCNISKLLKTYKLSLKDFNRFKDYDHHEPSHTEEEAYWDSFVMDVRIVGFNQEGDKHVEYGYHDLGDIPIKKSAIRKEIKFRIKKLKKAKKFLKRYLSELLENYDEFFHNVYGKIPHIVFEENCISIIQKKSSGDNCYYFDDIDKETIDLVDLRIVSRLDAIKELKFEVENTKKSSKEVFYQIADLQVSDLNYVIYKKETEEFLTEKNKKEFISSINFILEYHHKKEKTNG